ncbi:MAG: DNA repair protein RadC [Candidatus Eisenbacteria bacterium]
MKMEEIPVEDRPRERLKSCGVEALSVRELLAIVVGPGTKQMGAMDLAGEVGSAFESLRDMAGASVERLSRVSGMGFAKACRLRAAIELGKRVVKAGRGEIRTVRCPEDAACLVMEDMKNLDREHFKVILLDSKNAVISVETVSVGTVNASIVHPREALKPALEKSATSMILVHNHPTGNVSPSREDILITRRFEKCGRILGIEIVDHLIIGDNDYKSMKESGYL